MIAPIAPEDCPEPFWHETHRYCPVCSWREEPVHPKCGSVAMVVTIPAHLSHTGETRSENKPIDACIAPAVAALNAAGIETWGSCCGHGKGPASILTASGEVTFDAPFHVTHLGRVHGSPVDPPALSLRESTKPPSPSTQEAKK